eukprot:2253121-Prymnesium_polylepis.1
MSDARCAHTQYAWCTGVDLMSSGRIVWGGTSSGQGRGANAAQRPWRSRRRRDAPAAACGGSRRAARRVACAARKMSSS